MSKISITGRIIKDAGESVSYEDACKLADIEGNNIELIIYANKLRMNYKNNSVFTCSIINAKSGLCSQDCAFCAQSGRHKTGVEVYPLLSEEKLVENALRMEDAGATTYSMVASGFSPTDKELDTFIGAASAIKKKTSLSICTSIGVLTESTAKKLKECGVSTCHHNLETARSYFDRICTTHDYDDDVQALKLAKSAGLKLCSGGIFGLGEPWSQRVELAFTLKELDVDSIPINFLNPIAGTRMENMPLLSPMEALKAIALIRIINPKKEITICGGREKTLKDFQSWVFLAGANGLMIGNYLTTKGRSIDMDMDMIEAMGLEIIKGDKKWKQ